MIKKFSATIFTIAIAFAAGMVFQHQSKLELEMYLKKWKLFLFL